MYSAPCVRALRFSLLVWAAVASAGVEEDLPAEVVPAEASLVVDNPAFPGPVVEAAPAPTAEVVDAGVALLQRAEVAPYFATGRLADAKAAFDQGELDRARALLDDVEDTAPVRYLRASTALRLRDYAFAATEFETLAEAYSPMRERCLLQAGWAFEALKDFAGAERVYAAMSPGSRLAFDAALGLARARRFTKNLKAARSSLEPYLDKAAPPWGRDQGAEALLVLSELAQGASDEKLEQEALRKLWALHPNAPAAAKGEARLVDAQALGPEWVIPRAEQLLEAHKNGDALGLVQPLLETLKLPEPLACRAHFLAGKAHRKLREHGQAVAVLAPVAKRCKDKELKVKVLFTLGFSQGIVSPRAAAQTYAQLATEFPNNPLADDALFLGAEALVRAQEPALAAQLLAQLANRADTGDFTGDGLFKLFWLAWKAGQRDEALALLDELSRRFADADEGYEGERAAYWRGRVLEEAGRAAEAEDVWAQLSWNHPMGYYGLMAREALERRNDALAATVRARITPPPEAADPFPLPLGPLAELPAFHTAVELVRLGFGELVPTELLALDRAGLPLESRRVLVHLLALAQETRTAHGMARLWLKKDLSQPVTSGSRALWEIAYPKAFRDLVVLHAKAADELDPDLLQALMREESALDPKALSWAGALGLCQLMPGTAAGVAQQLKLKAPTRAALLEPDLNVQLGARYLSDLVRRAGGVKPYALAGYNAGEGAVARWQRERGEVALDEWVENIPLQETRGYVKRVLRSYNTYKLLYAPTEVPRVVAPLEPTKPGKPQASARP